ncbi:MAG: single-stranded-DNA-specific exonuclease RecJ [Planctomycetes bacterium]|nr:single-stranded-DNA-specific exonuclease RecJ [Planctomycetota bacterium]
MVPRTSGRSGTRRWQLRPSDPVAARSLASTLRISPALGQLLLNRDIRDPKAARAFLRPDIGAIGDPKSLPNLAPAMERIDAALRRDEKILVYGDYDVDGITGASLLVRFFRALGREVPYYVPHRVTEGYSLSAPAIEKFAAEGFRCMITVDCGTSDAEKIARAKELGIDVVVLDHHEPPSDLPRDTALVNPKLNEERGESASLCAAGVAFKLAWALAERLSPAGKQTPAMQQFLIDALGLVAIGTIADVVPLTGENRVLTAFGLSTLRSTKNPGLRALMEKAALGKEAIEAADIGFKIAPRLNAAGRLGSARLAVDLLVEEDPAKVGPLAEQLDRLNGERQKIEAAITAQAKEQVERDHDPGQDYAIVLADERWHQGVVGIVAARIVDRFHRPAVVIALDGDRGKGSGRSIPGFNLFEAISHCREHLIAHGGHEHAVGVQIEKRQVGEFRERLKAYARDHLTETAAEPVLHIDGEMSLAHLSREFVREIDLLAPHGHRNPKPVMSSAGLSLVGEPRIVGKRGDHLQFRVTQAGTTRKAVGFGMADAAESLRSAREGAVSLAYTPMMNIWQGNESVELHVKDIRVG